MIPFVGNGKKIFQVNEVKRAQRVDVGKGNNSAVV